jgi:DNA uptake protein ComE-like DNA-binding protein
VITAVSVTFFRRVVETREIEGPFATVNDLLTVPGLRPSTLERIRPFLTVRAATV